jgi:hypothetical protein
MTGRAHGDAADFHRFSIGLSTMPRRHEKWSSHRKASVFVADPV